MRYLSKYKDYNNFLKITFYKKIIYNFKEFKILYYTQTQASGSGAKG